MSKVEKDFRIQNFEKKKKNQNGQLKKAHFQLISWLGPLVVSRID